MEKSGKKSGGVEYFLDPVMHHSMREDDAGQSGHPTAEQPRLPSSGSGGELHVSVHNVEQEIMARAGLQSLGTSVSMGRGGVERILRAFPSRHIYAQRPIEPSECCGCPSSDLIENAPRSYILKTVKLYSMLAC